MPREATDIAHLWDMLHAARGIESAVAGLELEHYLQDEDLRMSVERRIEIIGKRRGVFPQSSRTTTRRFRGVGLLPSA